MKRWQKWTLLFLAGAVLGTLTFGQQIQNSITSARHRSIHDTDPNFPIRLTSGTPPSSECDEADEAGKVYYDPNGTTGQRIYACESGTGWVLQGDGGGTEADPNALHKSGGTMTGAITTDDSGNVIIVPAYGDPNAAVPAIRFTHTTSFEPTDWFIQVGENFTTHPEDKPLCTVYNGIWTPNAGGGGAGAWSKPATGRFFRHCFEGRYLNAGDPNVLAGLFEWNIDIDPNSSGSVGTTVRPWFWFYDMDIRSTTLNVGDISDPNSGFMQLAGGFVFWANQDTIRFGNRAVSGTDTTSLTTQDRIVIDPAGVHDNSDRAVIISNKGNGDLWIKAGIDTDGTTIRRIQLGYNRANVVVVGGDDFTSGRFIVAGSTDVPQVRIIGNSSQGQPLLLAEGNSGTDAFIVYTDRIHIEPIAAAPANCTIGDVYTDTSGAYCFCSATDTWEQLNATGACS